MVITDHDLDVRGAEHITACHVTRLYVCVLCQLDKEDVAASQTLRAALTKVEAANPGFTYDLVMGLVRKADVSVNMHESLLRLQGSAGDNDGTCSC